MIGTVPRSARWRSLPEPGIFSPVNIFENPESLERELGQRRRKLVGLSAETLTIIASDDAREVRLYRAVRQVAYLVFVWPLVFALAGFVGVWAAGLLAR